MGEANVKIQNIIFGDGGMDFLGLGQKASLRAMTAEQKKKTPEGVLASVDMELDRSLGGVSVRWKADGKSHHRVITLGHLKAFDPA